MYQTPHPEEQALGEGPKAVCESKLLPIKKMPRPGSRSLPGGQHFDSRPMPSTIPGTAWTVAIDKACDPLGHLHWDHVGIWLQMQISKS